MRPAGVSVVTSRTKREYTQRVDIESQCCGKFRGFLRAPAFFGHLLEEADVDSQGDGEEGHGLGGQYLHGKISLRVATHLGANVL
jgi:hypothetical protein